MFVFFLYIEIFFIYYEFYFIFLKTIITWSRWSNHLLGAQLFGVAQTRRSQRNNRAPQGVQSLRPLHFHFSGSMNRKAGGCRRVPPASSILDRLNLVKSSRTTSLYIWISVSSHCLNEWRQKGRWYLSEDHSRTRTHGSTVDLSIFQKGNGCS